MWHTAFTWDILIKLAGDVAVMIAGDVTVINVGNSSEVYLV